MCVLATAASGGSSVKPQTSHPFFNQTPGHLFAPAPQSLLKAEPSTSAGETFTFLSTLTVDSQPKASAALSTLTQDLSTVNPLDLHDYTFGNFTTCPQDQMNTAGGGDATAVSQDAQNAYGGPFPEDFPEFPSFSEVQSSDVDNINIDEIQALLGQSGLSEGGLAMGTSVMGKPEQSANPAGNGSTWMPLPPSIANYINHENMIDSPQAPPTGSSVLEDFEMMSSIDEDRLMSILASNNHVVFQPGHPT